MTLVRNTIQNYYGGVSKQADKLMQENALKEAINVQPSLTEGLIRRPPMQHISKLTGTLTYHPYIHTVTNDSEEYSIILDGETVRVFDMEGYEKTVYPYGLIDYDYVTTSKPLKNLYMVTINDYTFILNKNIEVEMDGTLPDTKYKYQALAFVAKGDYETTYTVKITDSSNNTYTATFETAASDSEDTVYPVDIASSLAANIKSVLSNSSQSWTVTTSGSTILIQNNSKASFTLTASDDNTSDDLYGFYMETGSYDTLPVIAPDGYIIKIAGDAASSSDDYFIKFHTTDGTSFGDGYWQECADPTLPYMLDPATMPHVLYRSKDDANAFVYAQVSWGQRIAGDETTAPSPSFVGNTIEEISTHKGRLTFLSNGYWLASDTNDVFQFFKASAREELDSDPIDITSNVGMTNLKHSLPYNGEMLVFSNTSCFTITGGTVFSNSTIGCDLTMEYECSEYCKPIKASKGGFFIYENGQYSRLREIYTDNTYNTNARDVTEHIPNYLPKDIYKLIGSSVNNMVLCLSTAEPENIYVYNYHFNADDTKVQSAWTVWNFEGATIYGGYFKQNLLYLFVGYSDGIYLNVLDFTPKLKENNPDFLFYLDRKVYFTDLEPSDNETILTLPYIADNELSICTVDGIPIDYTINGVTVTLDGEYKKCVIGNTFKTSFTFPVFYYRTSSYNTKTINNGLLMIKDVSLTYDDTGYFEVTVTPDASAIYPSTYLFTGVQLGLNSVMDEVSISSGSFLFPVLCKNDEVTITVSNNTYLPSNFLTVEWIGEYTKRGD